MPSLIGNNNQEKATKDLKRKRDYLLDELLNIIGEGIDEPAGSGCGFGIRKDACIEARKLLDDLDVTFNKRYP